MKTLAAAANTLFTFVVLLMVFVLAALFLMAYIKNEIFITIITGASDEAKMFFDSLPF